MNFLSPLTLAQSPHPDRRISKQVTEVSAPHQTTTSPKPSLFYLPIHTHTYTHQPRQVCLGTTHHTTAFILSNLSRYNRLFLHKCFKVINSNHIILQTSQETGTAARRHLPRLLTLSRNAADARAEQQPRPQPDLSDVLLIRVPQLHLLKDSILFFSFIQIMHIFFSMFWVELLFVSWSWCSTQK